MAQQSDHFRFMDLPRELRDMVFEEHFRGEHVNIHKENKEKCEATKSTRPNSSNNVFLVSKQFNEEARPHYLANTTFHLSNDCWAFASSTECAPTADLKNIVLEHEVRHDGWAMLDVATSQGFQEFLESDPPPRFSTITWVRLISAPDDPWLHRRSMGTTMTRKEYDDSQIVGFVRTALQSAKMVIFQMRPESCTGDSWDRDCEVSITAKGTVRILGRSTRDTELVAAELCRLFEEVEPSMIVHSEGPSPRPDYETVMTEERERREEERRLLAIRIDRYGVEASGVIYHQPFPRNGSNE